MFKITAADKWTIETLELEISTYSLKLLKRQSQYCRRSQLRGKASLINMTGCPKNKPGFRLETGLATCPLPAVSVTLQLLSKFSVQSYSAEAIVLGKEDHVDEKTLAWSERV